jgi:hypothetical protein
MKKRASPTAKRVLPERVCDEGRSSASLNRGSVIVHYVLQNLGVATQICALTRDCTHIL